MTHAAPAGTSRCVTRGTRVCVGAALTGVEEYVLVALVLRAGADEELRARPLDFFHLALAVVVVVQQHPVQRVSGVVAHGVKGDVGVRLPPRRVKKEATKDEMAGSEPLLARFRPSEAFC